MEFYLNQKINHKQLGNGIITNIIEREDGDPIIYVKFDKMVELRSINYLPTEVYEIRFTSKTLEEHI